MTKCRSIVGRDAVTGQSLRVTIESDRIQAVDPGPADAATWLSHGLIDLQVNGYQGCDLNGKLVDPDMVISLVHKLIAVGTTTFLPTIITAPEEKVIRALRAIAQARHASSLVAHAIPFVHIEGPHISPDDGPRGAHPREHVRAPDLAEFERWQQASDNLVGMVTLSPHWDNALKYIAKLASRGILVAIGHTHAEPDRIHAAVDAGATLSTHLGNGVASMLPRHPNLIWAQLADDRLTATFIGDGHHLSADTLRAMLRAKGVERSVLVSDSVGLAGLPPGIYDATIGDRVELRPDGRLGMLGTGLLAGAARPLSDVIAQLTTSSICGLADAIRMTTENPGRFVGKRGVLRPGAKADLLSFTCDGGSQALQIQSVLVGGGPICPGRVLRASSIL